MARDSNIMYISDQKTGREWQKAFNQWKHEYEIEIIWSFPCTGTNKIASMIKRTKVVA